MKRLLAFSTLLAVTLSVTAADGQQLRQAFTSMPDSLLPYLSRNNRLDMMDFMDSHMKAEVTNLLDGKSEMTQLTSDSLTVRLSSSSRFTLTVTPDTTLVVERTWQTTDGQWESIEEYYDTSWHPLKAPRTKSSTILNYYANIRNKR